jgi:ribosomal protein S18 acetylase RimI-like enzyme
MTVTIRHAGPGDEPAVVRLLQELALAVHERGVADEHDVRRYLASPDTTILLAADERDIVGMLSYSTRPGLLHAGDFAEIDTLVVLADRRREGIGGRLLRTGMRLMQDAGCTAISASVDVDDELAQGLCFDAGLTDARMRLERHFRR